MIEELQIMVKKQINKDNAKTYNIENQYNYDSYISMGTAFVPLLGSKVEQSYEKTKDFLYYPQGYLDKVMNAIETVHSILIQGEQGTGKSILSFEIADQMQRQELITSTYYLNPPDNWNNIKQWIQSIRLQNKEGVYLWIIDNLHKITNAVEDFPDYSFWGRDYCVCCTRDLNSIPNENDVYFEMALSPKQIFRRSIDKETFFECYNKMAVQKIGRHESDCLYQYVGGNLALLRYLITNGNLPSSLLDWQNGEFIDFRSIYYHYFGYLAERKITRDNLDDTLKMLFLSQIDFSIPLYLQCNTCQTVLQDFYFETPDKELEIEHASLAELLTMSICKEYRLIYEVAFADSLHWILLHLVNSRLEEKERARLINRFLQLLYSYKFILSSNQTFLETLSYDECLADFLKRNISFISLSTWKKVIQVIKIDSEICDIFHNTVTSTQFINTMCLNDDYDFNFFQNMLSQEEQIKVEEKILSEAMVLTEAAVIRGNEFSLMHLLLSLSEEAAVEFVRQIPSDILINVLLNNNNGLQLYARYHFKLGEEVKNALDAKILAGDYRKIFLSASSVTGFAGLLASATDSLKNGMCSLLTDGLADIIIQNTIEKNYPLGTFGLSLRGLKKKSADLLLAFEGALGVEGYEQLLRTQGTISVLMRIIESSSSEMRKEMSQLLQAKPELVKILLERTIKDASSIGALGLSLRELKKESADALLAFEDALRIEGYEELLKARGTIGILLRIIEYSSAGMQKEMSQLLQTKPELVKLLVERIIKDGSSIGTLGLTLRELKKESMDALLAFEGALGVEGYEELLKAQGTVGILASLIENSSAEMQKEMSQQMQTKPELIKILVERTIKDGSSIGTLSFSLRGLERESMDALLAFEDALGVEGYGKLLRAQGTLGILLRILQYSSLKMQNEMSQLLKSKPELVKILTERTVGKGNTIGTLNCSLRRVGIDNYSCLQIIESLIGVEGYLVMFSNCNVSTITILRIMACSSLSDSLVDLIYENMDVWDASRSYISENSYRLMKEFNYDLRFARNKNRRKFFALIMDLISVEEWFGWMRQGATLEEAVFIMRNLPHCFARQIADLWLQDYEEAFEDFSSVEQLRNKKGAVNSQALYYGITCIKKYNKELCDLICKDYNASLANVEC